MATSSVFMSNEISLIRLEESDAVFTRVDLLTRPVATCILQTHNPILALRSSIGLRCSSSGPSV